MLNDYSGPIEGTGSKICEPDYEQMIKSAREQVLKIERFKDAIFDFTGYCNLRGKMAELVGELESQRVSADYRIAKWIEEQEKK